MTKNETCWVEDCGRPATNVPAIRFWATIEKDHKPAVAEFGSMRVCDGCRGRMKLSDFIDENGRGKLEQILSEAGKAVPCWSTAELFWNPGQDA